MVALNHGLLNALNNKVQGLRRVGLILVSKNPWVLPTVIGRLFEEYGLSLYVVLTNSYVVEDVEKTLELLEDFKVDILLDYEHGQSLIRDNVFETVFNVSRILSRLTSMVDEVVIDVTCADSTVASATVFVASKNIDEGKTCFTHVDGIHLNGIPAYPGSPRWLHKVYVHGSKGIHEEIRNSTLSSPTMIEWRGSRGIFVAVSKLINSITKTGLLEHYDGKQRRIIGEDDATLTVNIHSNLSFNEKHRFVSLKVKQGPDDSTSSMIYNSWKTLAEVLSKDLIDVDRKAIDRIVMQIQRYSGSTDLVVKQTTPMVDEGFINQKLHRVLYELALSKQRVAVVFDTNLFYQGIHMVLLKLSIRSGSPWSAVNGLSIYVPKCAEVEINSKVAKLNPDAGGLQKLYYVMSLLANRSILEARYYYNAQSLEAVSQPCEVSIGVEAQTLPEDRVYLLTADRSGFTAWQTLNVCRGKVTCMYIGHSDKPLDADTAFSKLYLSIALTQLVFTSALFTPVTIESYDNLATLTLKTLKGSTAPVLSVNIVKNRGG